MNTLEYMNLKIALLSLDFSILSAVIFWVSEGYLRAVFRAFMVFCFADASEKIFYKSGSTDQSDLWFISLTLIILIIEIIYVFRRSKQPGSTN